MLSRSPRTLRPLVLGSFAAGLLFSSLALAAASDSPAELAARGSVTYRVYCSRCHGAGGKGDGKLASSLKSAPADLTTIASRHGGTFPAEAVLRHIDGREEVPAHETDMPTWGLSFQDPSRDSSQEKEIQAKLVELVEYLKTLQNPALKP